MGCKVSVAVIHPEADEEEVKSDFETETLNPICQVRQGSVDSLVSMSPPFTP